MSIYKYNNTGNPVTSTNPEFYGTVSAEDVNVSGGINVIGNISTEKEVLSNLVSANKVKSAYTSESLPESYSTITMSYGNGDVLQSTDGITWVNNKNGKLPYPYYRKAYYAGSTVVAFGNYNTAYLYSTDTVTWTIGYLPIYLNQALTFKVNNQVIATSLYSTEAAVTSDGITWVKIALPTPNNTQTHFVHTGEKYFLFSQNYTYTSEDLVTWTGLGYSSPTLYNNQSLEYINGIFSIVDQGQTFRTSTDGITWVWNSTVPSIQYANYYITKTNGLLFAIAPFRATQLVSSDGITWTQFTIGTFNAGPDIFYFDKTYYMMDNNNGFANYYYSTDLTTWSTGSFGITMSYNYPEKVAIYDVSVANTKSIVDFVNLYSDKTLLPQSSPKILSPTIFNSVRTKTYLATSGTSGVAAYSTDLMKWDTLTLPDSSQYQSVAYGDNKFVLSGTNNIVQVSTDLVKWNQSNTMDGSNWKSVAYIPINTTTRWTRIATGTTAAYSTDAITWTTGTMPSSQQWYKIISNSDYSYLAIASNSTNKAAYINYNNNNWTDVTLPISQSWSTAAITNNRLAVIASFSTNQVVVNSNLPSSPWTTATIPLSGLNGLAYGNNKFVGVKNNSSTIAISTNGTTWTTGSIRLSTWQNIIFDGTYFVAISGSRVSAYSTDAVTWNYFYDSSSISNGLFLLEVSSGNINLSRKVFSSVKGKTTSL
jgi:hypothetical protein